MRKTDRDRARDRCGLWHFQGARPPCDLLSHLPIGSASLWPPSSVHAPPLAPPAWSSQSHITHTLLSPRVKARVLPGALQPHPLCPPPVHFLPATLAQETFEGTEHDPSRTPALPSPGRLPQIPTGLLHCSFQTAAQRPSLGGGPAPQEQPAAPQFWLICVSSHR